MPIETQVTFQQPPVEAIKVPVEPLKPGEMLDIEVDGVMRTWKVERAFQNGHAFKLTSPGPAPIVLKPYQGSLDSTNEATDIVAERNAFVGQQVLMKRANQAYVSGIPRALGFVKIGEGPHAGVYSMESFQEGERLSQYLAHPKRLSTKERLRIFQQIARIVAELHHVQFYADGRYFPGIVHRDINPENILIDGYGRVSLADFGNAGVNGRPTGYKRFAPKNNGYAPLEQMEPDSIPQASDDVYGLGMILYTLFGGQPTDEILVNAICDAVMGGEEVDSAVDAYQPKHIPQHILRIIHAATKIKADERPTALEILAMTQQLLKNGRRGR